MNKSKASQEDPAVLLNKKRSSLIVGKPAAGCVVTRTSASQLSSRSSSASSLFSPGTLLRQPQQLIGDSIDEDDLDMHIFKSPSAFQAQLFKGQILLLEKRLSCLQCEGVHPRVKSREASVRKGAGPGSAQGPEG